jgi:hypothetical protein
MEEKEKERPHNERFGKSGGVTARQLVGKEKVVPSLLV